MKKVVITGATGAIGMALIDILIQNRIQILVVCHEKSKRIENIPQSEYVRVVECNLNKITELPTMTDETWDTFYHLAWSGTSKDSRNNLQEQLNNIQYTLNAVEAAKKMGCDTFIGAGSQAEYGRTNEILNASTPTFPENGYGIAKLCAGQMSRVLCEQKKMRHIWTRVLSVYGPYDGEQTMVMSAIDQLSMGNRISMTKGEQNWDYLYSKDAGNAFFLLGQRGLDGKTYCIGSGKTRTIAEYIQVIRDIVSPSIEIGFGEIPYSEKQVMQLCADISDLTRDTGFLPKHTFEEGIIETYNWFESRCRKGYDR